jgi:plastocyanin domain-containing protein
MRELRSSFLCIPFAMAASFAGAIAGCGSQSAPPPSDGRPEIAIRVDADGYHPAEANAPAGRPVRLVFTRTTDEGCGQQVVFPELGIRRDLPLNEPVAVDIEMPASGRVSFTCGMAMYQGAVVAR